METSAKQYFYRIVTILLLNHQNILKMKNFFFLSLFVVIGLISCKPKDATNAEGTGTASDTTMSDQAHTTQNAVDWNGMYKGVVPCADCEGIETLLILNADNTYVLRTNYIGKPDAQAIEKTGNLTWNAEGTTVTLSGIENAPAQYFVGENQAIQLDMSGNRITGELADKYILTKQ